MEIYSKDNKVLSYNNKCIKPKVNSETWVLNDVLNLDIDIFLEVDFISNNMSLALIHMDYDSNMLFYGEPIAGAFIVYSEENWTDQAYRTITFFKPPTGELLTWLQNNGVK